MITIDILLFQYISNTLNCFCK